MELLCFFSFTKSPGSPPRFGIMESSYIIRVFFSAFDIKIYPSYYLLFIPVYFFSYLSTQISIKSRVTEIKL